MIVLNLFCVHVTNLIIVSGARFAIYQTKMGLIKILHKFKVDVCEKTITTYVHNPNSLTLSPKGGIHLKINKVES